MNIPSCGKIVIQFGAPWCGPCKGIRPMVEELAKAQDAEFIYVDCDAEPALAAHYNVRNLPTVMAIKDNQELGRTGGASSNQIRTVINSSFGASK